MKCVKIENGIVVNSAIFDEAPDGWVESNAGIGRVTYKIEEHCVFCIVVEV